MSKFCNIYFVDKILLEIARKVSAYYTLLVYMISSLLHLVSLRPRVYYTSTNFKGGGGGGGQAPLSPPSIRQCIKLLSLDLRADLAAGKGLQKRHVYRSS